MISEKKNAGISPTPVTVADRLSPRRRLPVTEKMVGSIRLHFGELKAASVTGYSFERGPTDFPGARADLKVFDARGSLVLEGRDYLSGQTSYWRPSRVSSAHWS